MFFKKKKKPEEDELRKPLYEVNSERIVKVRCPYCLATIEEVYFMKINEKEFTSCKYCHKEFKK